MYIQLLELAGNIVAGQEGTAMAAMAPLPAKLGNSCQNVVVNTARSMCHLKLTGACRVRTRLLLCRLIGTHQHAVLQCLYTV